MEEKWKNSTVYQIYPRSFCDSNGDGIGDIQGITSKLEYIKDLGTEIIWLSPIYESPDKDNGYDISDYRKISTKFGTMEDFNQMLEKAHNLGLYIVMDLVVNHTSDQHEWFKESRSSLDNPKRDWYFWRDGFGDKPPTTQHSFFMDPAWTYDEKTGQYYFHNFAPEQADLNWDNKQVREEVYDIMRFWLDKGVDGFRMDVISLISKPIQALINDGGPGKDTFNGPHMHEYIKEMRKEVLSKYSTVTVGETPGATVQEAEKFSNANGSELDMIFQFEMVGLTDNEITGKWNTDKIKLMDLKKVTEKWQTGLYKKGWNSLYLDNHDQPRAVSRFGDTTSELFREKSAKMLATWLHFQQGTPYVYQGEELGMTNFKITSLEQCRDCEVFSSYKDLVEDKKVLTHKQMIDALNEHCRDHARTPMQWNEKENAGFTIGKPWIEVNSNYKQINVESQINDNNSIFAYYKKLIKLRKNMKIISEGKFEMFCPADEYIFAYRRTNENDEVTVICNFTNTEQSVPVVPENSTWLIGNYEEPKNRNDSLKAYEARVYIK